MAFLKFNKAELVNLSYSLKREIICANKTGAYCNTSIVTCNTRRYHGLLGVPVDAFGGNKYMLLSSVRACWRTASCSISVSTAMVTYMSRGGTNISLTLLPTRFRPWFTG